MDTFGPIAYVPEHCEIYFSAFLFLNLFIDAVVMVLRHSELTKMIGVLFESGKTLVSASFNIFLMSVLTSMYDPRASTLAAVEEEKNLMYWRRVKCYEREC